MENIKHKQSSSGVEWKEATVTSGSHLKRILEMYEELNLEVKVAEVQTCDLAGCTSCYECGEEKIYRVYTRNWD